MADLLRATKNVKNFHESLDLYFIDINQPLKLFQKESIKSHKPQWVKNIDEIPTAPNIIIANEFFDALPVIQYVRRDKRWYEVMITNKKDTSFFQFCDQPIDILTQEMLMEEFPNVPVDGIIEIPDEARIIMRKICNRLTNYGGAALIIDYGFTEEMRSIKSYISTLQAVKNHKYANIFESLGEADLTTQVNFSFLSDTSHKNKCLTRIITQREFLLEYGIDLRKALLIKSAKADMLKDIMSGYHRLIDPQQMGELFKAMIIEPQ
jgi:SAM-dependent MidA family methyltransferase